MSTRSAFCQFAVHDRCDNQPCRSNRYGAPPCDCPCHQPARQDPAQQLREQVVLLLALAPELQREGLGEIEALADQVIELVRAASTWP